MKLVIDLSSRLAITDFANATPANTYVIKSQDTAVLNVYFVQGTIVQDLGSATTLKFGLVKSGTAPLLVLDTVFSRLIDGSGNVYYQGFPVFNTSNLLTALGSNVSIACTGEVRYQQPDGEITHCLDIPFTVFRTILAETTSTTTTADFTQPAIGSNANVAVTDTSFLAAGVTVTIGTAGDSYSVISVTDATHFVADNLGTGTTAPGSNVAHPATVSLASPNVLATYPDVSQIELKSHKDQPCGYAGLSCTGSGYINNVHILVDGNTITNTDPAGLARADKLTYLTASFVQPAANATVVATVANSLFLTLNQAVYILEGGYYIVTAISGTSVTLQNNGDPANEVAGTTVPNGAALVPAQAVSSGGTPGTNGKNAFTTTTANFTTPAVNNNVTIAVGDTSWIGGGGQVLFIASAGYYSVVGVVDSTHVSIQNLGTASNVVVGTVISSGSNVTPGGATGAAAAAGFAAYDTLQTSFVMPAALATVSVVTHNTAWMSAGQVIYIGGAGYFNVSSITNATTAVLSNLNYTGNASAGATIAAGATLSPGGLVGPQGLGGSGKDAFTTVRASFTQPAVSSNVTAQVGQTNFMTAGMPLYVAGGGYYSISSVTDLTDVVLTNLGYAGNASPGATVPSGGVVTPTGVIGQNGANAFTTLTASFTMPSAGSTVTATVGNTGWMAQGQNIYIPAAGYFSVSVVTDSTHVVLINSGTSGNASSGTTIATSSQVSPAGSVGPTGPEGPQGAAGSGGGGGTSTSSVFDPRNGLYIYEDFLCAALPTEWAAYAAGGGGGVVANDANTFGGNLTQRAQGIVYLNTGGGASNAFNGATLARGYLGATYNAIVLGLGPFTMAGRIAIQNASLPVAGYGLRLTFGLWQQGPGVTNIYAVSGPYQACFLDYSPDNNSGNLRVGTAPGPNTTSSITYGNCTGTITAAAFHWWEMRVDTSGTVTVYMDGTLIGTFTGVAPLGLPLIPIVGLQRNASNATVWNAYVDAVYIYQPYIR